jgi:hypothetical protein
MDRIIFYYGRPLLGPAQTMLAQPERNSQQRPPALLQTQKSTATPRHMNRNAYVLIPSHVMLGLDAHVCG